MYQTLRREFMALDIHECVRNCTRCAKERISLRSHSQFLKLFPTARPLKFVALDILGFLETSPEPAKEHSTTVLQPEADSDAA